MTQRKFNYTVLSVSLLAILITVSWVVYTMAAPDNVGFVNNCLVIGEGADEDCHIVEVNVTGKPTFEWDESADSFVMTHPLAVTGIADGGLTNFDFTVGGSDYGMIEFGTGVIGRTSYNVGDVNLDGAIVIRNIGGPVTGNIELIITESGGATRIAIASSGAGLATYHPRSIFIGPGPAPEHDGMVELPYWQALGWFHNIDCDTAGTGADMGVQDDIEIEGIAYVDNINESTPGAGVTFDSIVMPSGITPAPDVEGAVFLDTNASANGSIVMYSDGAWRKIMDLP